MLTWVILLFFLTLLISVYNYSSLEPFTVGKDELTIPDMFSSMLIRQVDDLLDAGVFWKDVDMTRLQELLAALDNEQVKKVLVENGPYVDALKEPIKKQVGKEFVDLFQVKFYEDYHILLDLYAKIDQVTGATSGASNKTILQRHEYYTTLDTSKYNEQKAELDRLKGLLMEVAKRGNTSSTPFSRTEASYRTLSTFYKSGFKEENKRIVTKTHDIKRILRLNRSNFIIEYKATILRVLKKRMDQQNADYTSNAFELAKKNAEDAKIQTASSISFFSNIMDKLSVLEKKELVPVFTNKIVDQIAVDRYMDPACKEGESLFCSGEVKCTDIYGNEIQNMMKSEENASYRSGQTHSNCGSYIDRVEYKDWISSMSKNLVGPATEAIVYDTTKCTITNPWKLTTEPTCYLTVEKAQEALLQKNTVKNELLLGSTVLLETAFLEDLFERDPESIFNLNHPKENIQVQRLKYKGNMQVNEANRDIENLKKLPKVWANQVTYYKGKITQIHKNGYDLIIPDDYGIKVANIKKENLFMPDISYLKELNETLTDATVNSMPRPMCSGSFSKCSVSSKIEIDPSDTLKKNLINIYDKAAPYLLTSTEMTDSCPSSTGTTGSLGFSLF